MAARSEILPHTADIAVAVHADTPEELFAEAGRALLAIMVRAGPQAEAFEDAIEVRGEGHEELLYGFLSELLFRFLAEAKVYTRIEVAALSERSIAARCGGTRFDESRHELLTELKAVTLHQFEVRQDVAGWHARVIFDV